MFPRNWNDYQTQHLGRKRKRAMTYKCNLSPRDTGGFAYQASLLRKNLCLVVYENLR